MDTESLERNTLDMTPPPPLEGARDWGTDGSPLPALPMTTAAAVRGFLPLLRVDDVMDPMVFWNHVFLVACKSREVFCNSCSTSCKSSEEFVCKKIVFHHMIHSWITYLYMTFGLYKFQFGLSEFQLQISNLLLQFDFFLILRPLKFGSNYFGFDDVQRIRCFNLKQQQP